MAYYTQKTTLFGMMDHIYGRKSVLQTDRRPNLFVKELSLYMDYFFGPVTPGRFDTNLDAKKLEKTRKCMLEGIAYYKTLFAQFPEQFGSGMPAIEAYEQKLNPSKVLA